MPRLLSHLKCYAERKKWDSLESLQDDIAGRLEAVRERWGEARWGEVGCETALAGVAAEWQTGNDVEVEIKTRRECTICIALLRGDRRIIDLEIRSLESIVHLNKHSSIKRIAETTILANNSYHTFCNIFQQNAPFLSPNESFSVVVSIEKQKGERTNGNGVFIHHMNSPPVLAKHAKTRFHGVNEDPDSASPKPIEAVALVAVQRSDAVRNVYWNISRRGGQKQRGEMLDLVKTNFDLEVGGLEMGACYDMVMYTDRDDATAVSPLLQTLRGKANEFRAETFKKVFSLEINCGATSKATSVIDFTHSDEEEETAAPHESILSQRTMKVHDRICEGTRKPPRKTAPHNPRRRLSSTSLGWDTPKGFSATPFSGSHVRGVATGRDFGTFFSHPQRVNSDADVTRLFFPSEQVLPDHEAEKTQTNDTLFPIAKTWVTATHKNKKSQSVTAECGSVDNTNTSEPFWKFKPSFPLCTRSTRTLRKLFHEHSMVQSTEVDHSFSKPFLITARQTIQIGYYGSKSYICFIDTYRRALTALHDVCSMKKGGCAMLEPLKGISMVNLLNLIAIKRQRLPRKRFSYSEVREGGDLLGGHSGWELSLWGWMVVACVTEKHLKFVYKIRKLFEEAKAIGTEEKFYALLKAINNERHLPTDSLWRAFFAPAPSMAEIILAVADRSVQMAVLGHDAEVSPGLHLRVLCRSGMKRVQVCTKLVNSTAKILLLRYFVRLLTHCASKRTHRRGRARKCLEFSFALNIELYKRYFGIFSRHHQWCKDYQSTFQKSKQLMWKTNSEQVVRFWRKLLGLVALRRKRKIFSYKLEKMRVLNERKIRTSLVLHRKYYSIWLRWRSERRKMAFISQLSDPQLLPLFRKWVSWARKAHKKRVLIPELLSSSTHSLLLRYFRNMCAYMIENRAKIAKDAAWEQYLSLLDTQKARQAAQDLLSYADLREREYAAVLLQRWTRRRIHPKQYMFFEVFPPNSHLPPLEGIAPSDTKLPGARIWFRNDEEQKRRGSQPAFQSIALIRKMARGARQDGNAGAKSVKQVGFASQLRKMANPQAVAVGKIEKWWKPMKRRNQLYRDEVKMTQEAHNLFISKAAEKRVLEHKNEKELQELIKIADQDEHDESYMRSLDLRGISGSPRGGGPSRSPRSPRKLGSFSRSSFSASKSASFSRRSPRAAGGLTSSSFRKRHSAVQY